MALYPIKRVKSALEPLLFIFAAFYGIILVILDILTSKTSLSQVSTLTKVSERIFAKVWGLVGKTIFEREKDTVVPDLVSSASGIVLEIGPGGGNQLSRYDRSKVSKIYGIEPNADIHPSLRDSIHRNGLEDIYTIVPCGVEDMAKLTAYGITTDSIDSVVSVQVFCSIPQPRAMLKAVYGLLKPGGKLLIYEHVRAKDRISRAVQDVYELVWPHLMGHCHLTRPTEDHVLLAGEWAKIDLRLVEKEDPWLCIPHISGTLIKSAQST